MVSAEPHLYLTAPSVRIWLKGNRKVAVWAASLAAAVMVALVAALLVVLG